MLNYKLNKSKIFFANSMQFCLNIKYFIILFFISLLSFSFSQSLNEKDIAKETRLEFLAKVTMDFFISEDKNSIFDHYNMSLAEGVEFYLNELNKVRSDANKYKEYQEHLLTLLKKEFNVRK